MNNSIYTDKQLIDLAKKNMSQTTRWEAESL